MSAWPAAPVDVGPPPRTAPTGTAARRPAGVRPGCSGRREAGAGSVLVLAAAAVVCLVLAGALVVVAAVRDAHRARGAADLGALAAARGSAAGEGADCAAAAAVGLAAGATLTECRELGDGSVLVVVTVPAPWAAGWPGLPVVVTGTARAGPETWSPRALSHKIRVTSRSERDPSRRARDPNRRERDPGRWKES